MTGIGGSPPTAGDDMVQSVRTKASPAVGIMLLALAGCGQTVELDHPGELIASSDPNVLGTMHERVVQLRVDEDRLYWLTAEATVRGCEKERCATSVVTYAELASSAAFAVRGGELFYAYPLKNPGVLAVDVVDPAISRMVAPGAQPIALTTDSQHLYLLDSEHIEVRALGAKAADEVVSIPASASGGFAAQVIAAGGDYVYWLEVEDDGVDLQRARSDGTAAPEILVPGVRVDPYYPHGNPRNGPTALGLVVDDSYVYWSENVLGGAIKRVSVTGGMAEPETLVAPLRFPMALWLDGPGVYVEHESDAYQYTVSGCLLDHCTLQTLGRGLASTSAFAVDADYLYTATTSQSLDPDVEDGPPTTVLRRTPKQIGAQSP